MTPRERLLATFTHKTHDRVPLDIFPFNGYRTPNALGLKGFESFDEIYASDNDPIRESITTRLVDKTTIQHGISAGVNRYMITPNQRIKEEVIHRSPDKVVFKQTIDTPKGTLQALLERRAGSVDNIWTIEYPVKSFDDLEKLASIPFELPDNLEVIDRSTAESITADGRSLLYTYISSPFVCVGGTMSYEEFLYHCAVDLPAITQFVSIALERALQITEAVMKHNCIDIVWTGGSEWLTPPMSSPSLYKKLVVEPERELIRKIHDHEGFAHVHSHGNVGSPIINHVMEREADYFEPVEPPPDGNIEFIHAKEIAGENLTLGGNIELSLIEQGSPEQVREAAAIALDGRKDNMVLAISAPTNIPDFSEQFGNNIHTLIDVWEEMGMI